MHFPELDPFRKDLPQLSNSLAELEEYVASVFARPTPAGSSFDHAAHDIAPVQVANRLGVDEGLALVLLGNFEKAGIIQRRYDIYCPATDLVIDRVNSKAKLPVVVRCPYEASTDHSIHEYLVELVFSFSSRFVESHHSLIV
jgi:hypothetical protein